MAGRERLEEPGTAKQPHVLAYISDRTFTTFHYLDRLRYSELFPAAYYINNGFALPGIEILCNFAVRW